MTKEFIDEVNEDIKDEKIITIWQRFKFYIIGTIVVIIGGTAVNVGYDSHINSTMNEQALILEKNTIKFNSSEIDSLINNGTTGTVFLSTIKKAENMIANGKNVEASNMLYKASNNMVTPQKDYLILASVWSGMGIENGGELLNRLKKVNEPKFKTLKLFTKVEILLMEKKKAQAINVLEDLANDFTITNQQRKMATDILAVIK